MLKKLSQKLSLLLCTPVGCSIYNALRRWITERKGIEMKFFDTEKSMRTMAVEENSDYGLNVSNSVNDNNVQLFSIYNEGSGAIRLKLLKGAKVLSYDSCTDGNGGVFRIGY